jgi:hypothetical protein
MACDLTTGRSKACFDAMGGLKAIYFSTDDLGAITYDVTDTDVITAFAGTPEFFKYELKGSANTYTGTPTKDINNGTSFFAQSAAVQFPKLDKKTHKEIKLLLWASPTVAFEDYNGNTFIMGLENQADVTGGSVVTGGARGDLNGYTLTLTAEEAAPANFLESDLASTGATVSAVVITP